MIRQLYRFALLALLAMAATTPITAHATTHDVVHVWKTSGCGCCLAWITHLRESGFEVTAENVSSGTLIQHKIDSGVPQRMASCHTGHVAGYVVEGHVPAREIKRLLAERPDAIGLAVPGMPIGSPGMEVGDTKQAYNVYLIRDDGTVDVFATYEGL